MSNMINTSLQDIHYWIGWAAEWFGSGDWASIERGRGFRFETIADYSDFPDITLVNLPASLLALGGEEGDLSVSLYAREKPIDVYVLGNLCPSMAFGSEESKLERVALLAALISFSAWQRKDRFSFTGYTDQVELGFPSPRDRSYPFQLAEAILSFPWRGKTRGGLQQTVNQLPSRRSLVIIISDFYGTAGRLEESLKKLVLRHDVIPIVLWDQRELELPSPSDWLPRPLQRLPWPVPLRDLETGELKHVLLTKRTREAHRQNVEKQKAAIQAMFRRFGVEPYFFTQVTESDLEALIKLFLRRRSRL